MASVPGIDVYAGDVQHGPLQVGLAKQNGVAFIVAKATQGASSADPKYDTIRTQCATVGGILFGAYHYFQPGHDPIAQARFFVSTASPVSGDLRPMLDVEPTTIDRVVVNPDPHAAHACAAEIKRLTGYFPWLYSGADFYKNHLMGLFIEGPIWLARYISEDPQTFRAAQPDAIYENVPWPDMWQYTDHQPEPGTPAALDGDLYLNTLAHLKANHSLP